MESLAKSSGLPNIPAGLIFYSLYMSVVINVKDAAAGLSISCRSNAAIILSLSVIIPITSCDTSHQSLSPGNRLIKRPQELPASVQRSYFCITISKNPHFRRKNILCGKYSFENVYKTNRSSLKIHTVLLPNIGEIYGMTEDSIPMNECEMTDFDIYSTTKGLVRVTCFVQRVILHELSISSRKGSELVSLTGRPQPTISANLSKLIQEGMVTCERSRADRRVKIYTLASDLLIRTKQVNIESREKYHMSMKIAADLPSRLFRTLLETTYMDLDERGIWIGNVIKKQGTELAKIKSKSIIGDSIEKVISLHSNYLSSSGVGKVMLYSVQPLVLSYMNDLNVTFSVAMSYSMFFQGYFEVVISEYYGKDYRVQKVNVFGGNYGQMRMLLSPSA